MAYILPNGKEFTPWCDETKYTKILHVSQKTGSLDGTGSESKPFLTIEQAVPYATPGTKVIIHEGVYRETVRPIFSGKSKEEMVMFCGAEGEIAEITGAELHRGSFRESEGWKKQESTIQDKWDFTQPDAKVYMTKFDRNLFIGCNPFSMANGPLIPWYASTIGKLYHAKHTRSQRSTTLRRGLLFCGGGSGQAARLFTVKENIISDCARHITLPEAHNTVDGNIYGTSREVSPLRMLMPVSHHDLKHWQKNFGFDLQGKEETISYALEDDKHLALTVGDKTFHIDLTADIVPQIDAIFAN